MTRSKMKPYITTVMIFIVLLVFNVNALADVHATLPTNSHEKRIAVDLPIESEYAESPFDFVIDPQLYLFTMGTEEYGGGSVEEASTILFRNHESDYAFSSFSDKLKIRNRSNIPVAITITAEMYNLDNISMIDKDSYGDEDTCSMYMAIVDDRGNRAVVSENGIATIRIEMDAAPEDAYLYKYNEETGSYDYVLSRDESMIDWPEYSFGLKGSCNPKGNWFDRSFHPYIRVKWSMEALETEELQYITETKPEEKTPPSDEFTDNENVMVDGGMTDAGEHIDTLGNECNSNPTDPDNGSNELKMNNNVLSSNKVVSINSTVSENSVDQ